MAVLRDRPYQGFNFLVDLGDGVTDSVQAGFQEASGLGLSVDVVRYRNGNARENQPLLLPGLSHCGNVTLKRGIVGALNLYAWLDQIRNGSAAAYRDVTIRLQSEDRAGAVLTWRLLRALIVKYAAGPLNGRASEVAIEEIVLSCERLELE